MTTKNIRSPSTEEQDDNNPFMFLVPKELEEQLCEEQNKYLESIKDLCNIQRIHITKSNDFKVLDQCLVQLYSQKINNKRRALELILEKLEEISFQGDQNSGKRATILILDTSVSIVIGYKGRQIKQIQDNTLTDIMFRKQVQELDHRPVDITGQTIKNVGAAAEAIYQFINDKRHLIDNKDHNKHEKKEQTLLEIKPQRYKQEYDEEIDTQDRETQYINIKFLFTQGLGGAIIGRNGSFTKQLSSDFNVILKIKEPNVTGYDYSLAELQGKYKMVVDSIKLFLEKVDKFDKAQDRVIKMLINQFILNRVLEKDKELIKNMSNQYQTKMKVMEFAHSIENDPSYIFEIDGDHESKVQTILNFVEECKEEFLKMKQRSDELKQPSRENSPYNNYSHRDRRREKDHSPPPMRKSYS